MYFISGAIGNKNIVKEDLSTFLSGIKDFEWTDNNIYKPAKVVEVRPTFVTNVNDQSSNFQPKNVNFDLFYVEENSHLQDFQQYKMDIENRRVQLGDKILSKKKEFVDTFFPGENVNESSNKKEILEYIKSNKAKIIANSNLNNKLGKYISYLGNSGLSNSGSLGMNLNNTNMSNTNNTRDNFNYDFTLLGK
jgi:hypothetical protein